MEALTREGSVEMEEFDRFRAVVAGGAYKHLTPRPSKPSELSLEQVAALYVDEVDRKCRDQEKIQHLWLFGGAMSWLLPMFLFLAVGPYGDEQFNAAMSLWALGLVAFCLLIVAGIYTSGRVSAARRSQLYQKQLEDFLKDVKELARILGLSNHAELMGYKRDQLEELGLLTGTRLATQMRQSEKPLSQEARIALTDLFVHMDKFGLAPKDLSFYIQLAIKKEEAESASSAEEAPEDATA